MKKFIIILLLILPIFLMVTISIAGRIFSYLTYISVDRVEIVDVDNNPIETLTIGKGEEITLNVNIYPELANNKKLSFVSLDETIATIDSLGVLKGVDYGYTEVIVKSLDTDVTDKIGVIVEASEVESVDIYLEEKEIYLYQSYTLSAIVYPIQLPSEKKTIVWSSSDPTYVEVDQNGKITAKKVTVENQYITITATSVNGEKTDTCRIKVLPHLLAFKPLVTNNETVYVTNQLTVNLKELIIYDATQINENDIKFKIIGGKTYAEIDGDNLVFKTDSDFEGEYIIVQAYVEGSDNKINFDVRYLGNKS